MKTEEKTKIKEFFVDFGATVKDNDVEFDEDKITKEEFFKDKNPSFKGKVKEIKSWIPDNKFVEIEYFQFSEKSGMLYIRSMGGKEEEDKILGDNGIDRFHITIGSRGGLFSAEKSKLFSSPTEIESWERLKRNIKGMI